MRFGAFVPQGWRMDLVGIPREEHWPTMVVVARAVEAAGFESLWVYDHFHTVPEPSQEVTYEAWTLMAALAVATEGVRLGQMCTCNSYRPPAYLAKVAASIDVISEGRLEMGIGAGWHEHEYLGYGYRFPKASTRIGMLREGVEIMVRMWTEAEVDFAGDHYRLKGAICSPKPVQDPHPPLWIAGGGEKLTLRLAAERAAYTNFANSVEDFRHKSDVLAGHCQAVGRDFSAIVRSANFNVVIAGSQAEVEEQVSRVEAHYAPFLPPERLSRMVSSFRNDGLVGTPEQIVALLEDWQAAGLGYAICYFVGAAYDGQAGIRLFAEQVAPRLSGAG